MDSLWRDFVESTDSVLVSREKDFWNSAPYVMKKSFLEIVHPPFDRLDLVRVLNLPKPPQLGQS